MEISRVWCLSFFWQSDSDQLNVFYDVLNLITQVHTVAKNIYYSYLASFAYTVFAYWLIRSKHNKFRIILFYHDGIRKLLGKKS